MKSKKPIPLPETSPFAPAELVDDANLSSDDHDFLEKEEAAIEAGRRTFMDVAAALMRIRDYKNGLLYKKRWGTWEAYCTERWDFGRSYALRLTDAAEIAKMLPMGNKSPEGEVLPSTERQIRPLSKLPTPALRGEAWEAAVDDAGDGPVFGRHVEKAVKSIMQQEGLESERRTSAAPTSYRLDAGDLKKLQKGLSRLRKLCATVPKAEPILSLIDELNALLPGTAQSSASARR